MNWRLITTLFALWAVSLIFFLSLSFGLGAGIDVADSKVFEMDVSRVVVDWTCKSTLAVRTEPHPLYRLFVTPMGSTLREWLGGAETGPACRSSPSVGLEAARLLTGVFMAVYVVSTALLIGQLNGGSVAAVLLGGAVCMVSFSSILLAVLPDSASLSGLGTLFPLLFLNTRRKQPCTWTEVIGWVILGLFCIGITITQVMNWLIALAFRFRVGWRRGLRSSHDAGAPSLRRLAVIVALFLVSFAAAQHVQRTLYKTPLFHPGRLVQERAFSVMDDSANDGDLGTHVTRVLLHFFGYNFAAPFPALSYRYLRYYPIQDQWMLSLVEAEPADWLPLQRGLAVLLLIGFVVGAAGIIRADVLVAAPLACIAAQLALHLVYGDEYILYSTNWHGALVAVLVTGVWRWGPTMRRVGGALWVAAAFGLLANNVVVLNWTYTQMEGGLEEVRRDAAGELKHPPDGPACRHFGILCPQRDP